MIPRKEKEYAPAKVLTKADYIPLNSNKIFHLNPNNTKPTPHKKKQKIEPNFFNNNYQNKNNKDTIQTELP